MRLVRVDDRSVVAIAAVSGVVATFADVSPVGSGVLDRLLVVLAVGSVTWASASAPWWALVIAAGGGALAAFDPVIVVLAAGACIAGLWLGTQRRDLSLHRAAVGGVAANVLCRLEMGWFSGASALIGVSLSALLVVIGLLRRHTSVRRWALRVGLGLAALAIVSGIAVGVAGLSARTDVTDGRELVAGGIELLRSGEYAEAAISFDQAATAFTSADSKINRPWAQPARLLPVAAQNRQAVAVLASRAADAAQELANASLFIEPGGLKVTDGRFDIEAVAEVERPLTAAYQAMVDLRTGIDDVDSPWLLPAVTSRLDAAADEFDENVDQVETAVQALQLAPALLGGEGTRHYFIAFTTPAEARGLGGFMGNYAVLTAEDGMLSMGEFGRTSDLNRSGGADRRLDPPDEWAASWGRYGFTNGVDGATGLVPWSNITISPHFPSTARVIDELFPLSGGTDIDGVFAMDPYVLQAMMGFTGPIDVDTGSDTTQRLTEQNTAQFLLFDQYAIEDAEARVDLLEQVAELVVDRLLGGALPGPTALADRLGTVVDDGRLVGWMQNPDEQALIERVGLSGGLPEHAGADGFQMVVNNAGANKLDAYLGRALTYRAVFDPTNRVVVGSLDVTFTNNGPTSGFPSGVIDNYVGDPVGTNRSLVTVYTSLPVTGITFDDEVIEFEPGTEAGWESATMYVVLPPGESRTLSIGVAGQMLVPDEAGDPSLDLDRGYELVVGTQPLVVPAEYDLEVTNPEGDVLFEHVGASPGQHRYVADSRK